jgi:hypothetical protein
MADLDRIDREGRVVGYVNMLLKYQLGLAHRPEAQLEINRVIDRLLACNGQYWRLSERDDAILEAAITYCRPIQARRSEAQLRNEKHRAYGGTIVSNDDAKIDEYFDALRATSTRRQGDRARIERVAQELLVMGRHGRCIWREPKPAARRYKRDLPEQVLTDEARARLSTVYANGTDTAAISRKDLLKCVKKAETLAEILSK